MRYFFKDTVNSQNHLARKRHCGTSCVITFELSLQLWKKVLYEILNISIEPRWLFQTFIHVITWISLICSKEELNCPSVMLIRFSSVHLYVAYFTIKTVYIVKSEIKKKRCNVAVPGLENCGLLCLESLLELIHYVTYSKNIPKT